MLRHTSAAALAALLAASAGAQPPDPEPVPLPLPAPIALKPPKGVPQPTEAEAAALAQTLRGLMLEHLPDPLVKSNDGWGNQKEFVVGGLMLRNPKKFGPEAPRQMFNDGLWRRITLTGRKPADTLGVGIPELVRPTATTAHLVLDVAMDVDFRVEHQLWKRGLQIYSGETRGHCKAGLKLTADVESKITPKLGSFLPDVTLVIKATDAKVFYDKVVIDHTAGLDGDDAKKAGDFVLELVKAVKPDLEKQLLDKANASVLKAVGSKEIKVQLDKLIGPPGAKK